MADAQGEKTEKPTPKKLHDAKEKGQIARSRDLTTATTTLAVTALLAGFGYFFVQRLQSAIVAALTQFARTPLREVEPGELVSIVLSSGAVIGMVAGPIAFTVAAISVATSAGQGGLRLSATPLAINWERLSPKNGFSRLAPSKAGVDTLKAMLVAAALAFLAWTVGRDLAGQAARLAWSTTVATARYGWTFVLRLLWQAGFLLLVAGIADYGLQYWRHRSSLKMTRKEVRDDAKASEGRPEVKSRVRRIQRDMARRRMVHATSHATVVITNPTHFAVALEYRREKSPAPVVVAKGRDLIAARIREIARAHGVPIIENPSLARALYKGAEVGETIPSDLFGAVAEVLAYLIRIKQLMF